MPLTDRIVSLLSRRTSGRALIPEIDGLRSVAIMSVVIFHAAGFFAARAPRPTTDSPFDAFLVRLFNAFDYGVPIFFAISGFILAVPFASYHLRADPKPSLQRYLLRRITRLEPPYIVALVAMFLLQLAGLATLRVDSASELFPRFLASLFYVHNIVYGKMSAVLGVAWSLEVEVQFYLLAPLITMVFAVRSRVVRRTIVVIAIAAMSWLFGVQHPIEGLSILNHAPYFLVGLLLADLYLCGWDTGPRPTGLWDAVALAAMSGAFLAPAYHLAPPITVPWLILIAFAAVFRSGIVRRFFRATPVVILGGMCYSIYLWHAIGVAAGLALVFKVLDPDPTWAWRIGCVLWASIPAVGIGVVFFVLIERPTMDPRWPQKLWSLVRRGNPQAEPVVVPARGEPTR